MEIQGIQGSKLQKYLYQVPLWLSFYSVRPRSHQFANLPLLTFLAELSLAWKGSPIGLGDVSLENGTAPPTHHTHVYGSCVDLYVFHKRGLRRSGNDNNVVTMHDDKETIYDQPQTIRLATTIKQVVADRGYNLVQFLFDDPAVSKTWTKITQSKHRPHLDHFHIQIHEQYRDKGKEADRLQQAMIQQRCGF
ncbi:MAG: hypothetical protein KDA87_17325 [Planctomycetales bacterium]|nr:hypothetical protein [Planctomycetales bacterium]